MLVAEVFGGTPVAPRRKRSRPASTGCALEGTGIVNLSFGLREDRPVLRAAVEAALAAGMILVGGDPGARRHGLPGAAIRA